jgi:mono/diheme cytochrome c family protein
MNEHKTDTLGTSTKPVADMRNKSGIGFLSAAFVALFQEEKPPADPADPQQVARGKAVYAQNCAACHGAKLACLAGWFASLCRREPQSVAFSIDFTRVLHFRKGSIERFVGDTEITCKVL